MKEYEFDINIEIGIIGESCEHLKLSKLKKDIENLVTDYFEKENSVAEYDIINYEVNSDFEVKN